MAPESDAPTPKGPTVTLPLAFADALFACYYGVGPRNRSSPLFTSDRPAPAPDTVVRDPMSDPGPVAPLPPPRPSFIPMGAAARAAGIPKPSTLQTSPSHTQPPE